MFSKSVKIMKLPHVLKLRDGSPGCLTGLSSGFRSRIFSRNKRRSIARMRSLARDINYIGITITDNNGLWQLHDERRHEKRRKRTGETIT